MNTSDRVKIYLSQMNVATVDQLSNALDLTKADIHYHIRQLLERNEISIEPILKRSTGAGRPARQYRLTESVPITTTRLIVTSLLTGYRELAPSAHQESLQVERIAQSFLSCCPSIKNIILSPAIKLNMIIKELSSLDIHLTWEAGKNGPVIRVLREPFSTLLGDDRLAKKVLNTILELIKKEIA